MSNSIETQFAIGTMQSHLIGATITKIIQAEPDSEGNVHYGFEAIKSDKVIRAWVLSDPEGNTSGYLDICI